MNLVFCPENHTYTLDGDIIPSVTQVITSFFDRFEFDMTRGTAIHMACHYLDEGDLDEATVAPEAMPYVVGYKKFLGDYNVKWEGIEKPCCNEIERYACTPDRWGIINGVKTLVEIKSNQGPKWADIQLAAQNNCLGNGYIPRVLHLKPFTYRLDAPITTIRNIQIFRAMLTVYNYKLTTRS